MGKEMEKRTCKIKNGMIFGIILLLFIANIVPTSIGQKQRTSEQQTIPETPLQPIEKTASFTFYVIGKNGGEKQEMMLSTATALTIYEHYQELQREMTLNPSSDTTQRIQQDFIRLLIEHDAIPTTLSQEQLFSLIRPPTPPLKHLPRSILPFQNKASEWFCNFATFGEGAAFPIIILPRFIPIILTPIPRVFIYWSTEKGLTSVGGLLSGTGFLAGGQQKGIALGFWGIGFSIFLPPVRSYGIFGYALYTRVAAEQFEFYPPNNPPRVTQTDPADGQQFVPLSTKELRFAIEDKDKDPISYSVTTEPDIGSDSGGLKPDGTYSVAVSGLESLTTYSWTIELTDGMDITKKTLTFTTEPVAPVISNPLPKDNAEFISVETMSLSFDLMDHQGDVMDWTVETQPDIGSGAATGVKDGRCMVAINGLDYFTSYKWFVNVTDGEHWTRKTYNFRTIAEDTVVVEAVDDSYVSSTIPNQNAGNLESISIRSGGSGNQWWAAPTIKFDLSSLPTETLVLSATLNLFYYAYADGNPVGRNLVMYRFLDDWNESTITWSNMPSINPTQTTTAYVPSAPGTWITWDVTADVQKFLDRSITNYGWIIKDETSSGLSITYIRSKEYSSDSPYLFIELTTPE
jgi:hypothetical protein